MIDPPQILQLDPQPTAVVHITIPRSQIQQVMGPAIGEAIAAARAQGVGPAGHVFAHHFRITPDSFDFEVGIPVRAPIQPSGRVRPGVWPAMRVARTTYRGPYESLGAAWGEFHRWIRDQTLSTTDDIWECYVVGPESGPDPAAWQTHLIHPLTA
ncbi:MAG: GyrI-like domain-containing protein [Phycisphaerales bacterium]|nr:GyrI-like domain-containing protein [Phycisphaerales bacterium]